MIIRFRLQKCFAVNRESGNFGPKKEAEGYAPSVSRRHKKTNRHLAHAPALCQGLIGCRFVTGPPLSTAVASVVPVAMLTLYVVGPFIRYFHFLVDKYSVP